MGRPVRHLSVMIKLLVVPMAGLVLAACAAQDERPREWVYPEPEAWLESRLGLTEELSRLAGDEVFRVSTVLVEDDGSMILVQRSEALLRFYGPDGRSQGTVGREGEGPGEFLRMDEVGWLADSLFVYDSRQRRYTIFGPDRSFERVQRIEPTSWSPAGGAFEHVYPGDTVLVWAGNAELGSTERTYALTTPGGDLIREIVSHAEGQSMLTFGGPGSNVRGQVVAPYAAGPAADVSSDGSRIAVAEPLMEEPHPASVALTVVDAQGDTVFVHAARTEPVPVDRAAQERELEESTRRWPGIAERVRTEVGLPDYYPPFERVLVGRDGSVWLEMRGTEEQKPYRVWSSEGEPVGTLVIPREHRLLEAEIDQAWILERDELDVESVAHYRVQ